MGIDANGQLIKANSWRLWKFILEARKAGQLEIETDEWGDDGAKTWSMKAHANMMRHPATASFACSNMAIAKSKGRKTDFTGMTVA
jgi:hypothetical protein